MSGGAAVTAVCQYGSVLSCAHVCFCKEVGVVGEGVLVTLCSL